MELEVGSWDCFSQVTSGMRGPSFIWASLPPLPNRTESWGRESAPVCLGLGENKTGRKVELLTWKVGAVEHMLPLSLKFHLCPQNLHLTQSRSPANINAPPLLSSIALLQTRVLARPETWLLLPPQPPSSFLLPDMAPNLSETRPFFQRPWLIPLRKQRPQVSANSDKLRHSIKSGGREGSHHHHTGKRPEPEGWAVVTKRHYIYKKDGSIIQ